MERYFEDQFFAKNSMCAFRLSCIDGLALDKTFHHLKDVFPILLCSAEGETRKFHIHGVVAMATSSSPENFPLYVRTKLKELYPMARGIKCIYVRLSKNKKQLLKYTLKEGQFQYQGFRKELIEKCYLLSSVKENLNKKIQDNEELLLTKKINYTRFVTTHLEIIVSHNQNLYVNHVKSYFNKMKLKSGEISYYAFAEENFLL